MYAALGSPAQRLEDHLDDASAIEIVPERDAHVYGFTIKTAANPFLHRVTPLRDPSQPRFWCVVVFRCTAGGLPDSDELPWISKRQLRREEIADTMQAIRADPVAWLAEDANADLREWILTPASEAPAVDSTRAGKMATRAILAAAGRKSDSSADHQIEAG
jgi:hypothetical protein